MIIKKIACGNSNEAFVEDRLTEGFNIIYSDDNNKGKTIVIQSALYAIGNEPIFPSSFDYKDCCHYVEIVLDNGKQISSCRKGNSFIVRLNDSISILDSVSELKRYLNRNGMNFPIIIKDNAEKMVDPVLLYQLFFVGQDMKDSSTIFHDNYYKKDDFWNMIYAFAGIESQSVSTIDHDEIREKIQSLKDEQKVLISQNTILKSASPAIEMLSQKNNNDAFENKVKKISKLRDAITEVTKQRNRALHRKSINEKTLKELRALSRTQETGSLYCMDCNSTRIGYASGDKSYTFDITDVGMRKNIIDSIKDKIDSYQEEIENCSRRINELQKQLQELLKVEEVDLRTLLLYRDDVVESSNTDQRLVEIGDELKKLKTALTVDNNSCMENHIKRDTLRSEILHHMNSFYHYVDPEGTNRFEDLFSKRHSVYSGVEETEFYLSKLYGLVKGLNHTYPVIMDYFRDGELSSYKEDRVIKGFSELKNQIIFTATLKNEEMSKYRDRKGINGIDYSVNKESHILMQDNVPEFQKLLQPMMVEL